MSDFYLYFVYFIRRIHACEPVIGIEIASPQETSDIVKARDLIGAFKNRI